MPLIYFLITTFSVTNNLVQGNKTIYLLFCLGKQLCCTLIHHYYVTYSCTELVIPANLLGGVADKLIIYSENNLGVVAMELFNVVMSIFKRIVCSHYKCNLLSLIMAIMLKGGPLPNVILLNVGGGFINTILFHSPPLDPFIVVERPLILVSVLESINPSLTICQEHLF